ncbi:MAG: prepilin-type N-terminal cleavage/methylation domain-containing protein [Lachnospiraceae bacterium]|nr:prepilin-type N-terminal cleavage/methylation domain-containing protein [Lachnospiraceae bacterium]
MKNKGFSLVELIIVIAIMAILVGVMAPQLIKYIEKSKVSADTQAADAVHTAILTAMMDPEVVNNSTYNSSGVITGTVSTVAGLSKSDVVASAALEILGESSGGAVDSRLKSTGASAIKFAIVGNNKVSVWVLGSDSRGSKSGSPNIVVE